MVNIAPKDFALFEQRFDAQLRIQNPNETDLGINGLRFDMDLNDQQFANAMSGQKVSIPRFGSEVVNVEMITGTGSFLRQFQEFNKSGVNKVRYRLKGTIFVESPSHFKLPFDETGDVDLNLGTLGTGPQGEGS
jgi:LEA14-like dessication related protein